MDPTSAASPIPQDPEVQAYIAQRNAFFPADAFSGDIEKTRAWFDRFSAFMMRPPAAELQISTQWFDGVASHPRIEARRYHHTTAQVCDDVTVLYVHGGGFVMGGLDSYADVCAGLCELTNLDVVACTYRLAPEHGHPAQLDDVEAVFSGLRKQGRRVVLCGDSAGGNLVAGLCVRLQSKGQAPALGQVLIYPGLGGDRTQGSYISNANAAGLTTKDCDYYFTVRALHLPPAMQDHPEMRPLLADDLSGTPPTLVITADLDPLRDDGVQYAKRLQDLKLVVQYRNEPELIHGYLRARHISKRAANSVDAIARGLLQMAKEEFV